MSERLSIFFTIINCLILIVTIYYIATAPIRAVKAGRKLNDEQRFDFTKRNLFLTLFSYRGSANHVQFVEALNQIDVIFHGVPLVLQSWHKYYDSLQIGENVIETDMHRENWRLLRIDLLSEMANHLGYGSLKQIDMMKHYYSRGQDFRDQSDFDLKMFALEYLRKGTEVFQLLIDSTPLKEKGKDEKQS